MSLDAIQKVTEAEEKTRRQRAEAQEQAKTDALAAERAGKSLLEQALRQAEEQVKKLRGEAEKHARERICALEQESAGERDALRRAAEQKLDAAAQGIVKRVVEG